MTIGAMDCQRATTQIIVKQGGDYLLSVKDWAHPEIFRHSPFGRYLLMGFISAVKNPRPQDFLDLRIERHRGKENHLFRINHCLLSGDMSTCNDES